MEFIFSNLLLKTLTWILLEALFLIEGSVTTFLQYSAIKRWFLFSSLSSHQMEKYFYFISICFLLSFFQVDMEGPDQDQDQWMI